MVTKTINSITGLLPELEGLHTAAAKLWWYRGQADARWTLQPSIIRTGTGETVDREIALTKRFRQNAAAIVSQVPTQEFEWLFLMQHHRMPTRLLDWSESPLVALYFAVEDEKSTVDGALWCLDPIALNKEANIDPPPGDLPSFASEDIINSYLPSKVTAEKTTKLKPVACIGPRNSPRMNAQQGVFTITHREPLALESINGGNHLVKIIIPADKREKIRKELFMLGTSRLSLFPELESVALLAMSAVIR